MFPEDFTGAHEQHGTDAGVVWLVSAKSVASSLLGVRGLPCGWVPSVDEGHELWCSCAGGLDRVEDFVCSSFVEENDVGCMDQLARGPPTMLLLMRRN